MINQIGQTATQSPFTGYTDSSKATSATDGLTLTRVGNILVWLLIPLTLGLAITRQSLWTDEGFTVWFASHRSFSSFLLALVGSPGAPGDSQIILYLIYMWGWIKIFGKSEVALRMANIPFAILFIGAMSWACHRLLRRPILWVYFCLSPFFWFYLNEARPYIALLAFSGIATVALLAYFLCRSDYKRVAPWCCLVALLFAWGTHIMAAFLFPALAVFAAANLATEPEVRRNFFKDWRKPALWCFPAFIALAGFYIAVSGYGVNKYGKSWPSSLIYVLYEFAGFGGLGPPRNQLRTATHLSIFLPYWPSLLTGVIAVLGACLLLVRFRPPKVVVYLAGSLLVGMAIALQTSIIGDFQILDRHMAALFPLFLITLLLWLNDLLASKRHAHAAVAAFIAIAVAWGIADSRLVFLDKYQKDSYRDASAIALDRVRVSHGTILWAADPHTAYYYGVRVVSGQRAEGTQARGMDWPIRGDAIDARNWSAAESVVFLNTTTTPTILVLSKADAFDSKGVWRSLVQEQKPTELARLNAFAVYEWQPQTLTRAIRGAASAY